MVPAATGETVAVIVTLTPYAAVVIAVAGAEVSPAFNVVVVFVAVALALVAVIIKNKSRVAKLPQFLRMVVIVVVASLRIAGGDVDCL
jgi:hypothetical protein